MPSAPSIDVPFALSHDPAPVQRFLEKQHWLRDDEKVVSVAKAGEGNMNRTLRATTDRRSVILKQSFAWCAKFPDIPAPIERIETEVAFYEVARRAPALAERMPAILGFAPADHIAMIEDLGAGSDLLSLYAGDTLREGELTRLGSLARTLHAIPLSAREKAALRNQPMRELNHEHIFDLPLRPDNGIDLEAVTPGLSDLAAEARGDRSYVDGVAALGEIYLHGDGPALLHGDYYPGSFLRTERGLMIIDPEFAFPGPPEFDLSVLVAHLVFAGGAPDATVDAVLAAYGTTVERPLVEAFAGAELMRRTLGVSQLPVAPDLTRKRTWIDTSRRWVHAWAGTHREH